MLIRNASRDDLAAVPAFWQEAAENRSRPVDLIAAAEERLRGFGAGLIDAMVLDGNVRAHGIWAAHGFEPQGDWSRWVKPLHSAQ